MLVLHKIVNEKRTFIIHYFLVAKKKIFNAYIMNIVKKKELQRTDLMLKYILPCMVCLTGLIFFSICVIVSTSFSLETPVFLFLNFVSNSVVVMGFRIRYRRTASSVIPLSLKQTKNWDKAQCGRLDKIKYYRTLCC